MWARLLEMVLGLWLVASTAVFADPGHGVVVLNLVLGALVVLLAGLSFLPKLRSAHAGSVAVAVLLAAWGWASFPRPGPAAAQNQILTALLLGLVAFVPSQAGEPPPAWREYVAGSDPD